MEEALTNENLFHIRNVTGEEDEQKRAYEIKGLKFITGGSIVVGLQASMGQWQLPIWGAICSAWSVVASSIKTTIQIP